MGNGPVSVAELPVVVTFKAGMRVVVGDGESVDKRVGALDFLAQKRVKAIFVDALPGYCAAETTQTAAVKREFAQIDHSAFIRQRGAKIGNHIFEIFVFLPAVGHDHHVFAMLFGRFGKLGLVYGFLPFGRPGGVTKIPCSQEKIS